MSIKDQNAAIEARNRVREETDRRRAKKINRDNKAFPDVYGRIDDTEPCKSCKLCEDK